MGLRLGQEHSREKVEFSEGKPEFLPQARLCWLPCSPWSRFSVHQGSDGSPWLPAVPQAPGNGHKFICDDAGSAQRFLMIPIKDLGREWR